jgi:16S rRNA (guanine1516-N2)-methyltransferase
MDMVIIYETDAEKSLAMQYGTDLNLPVLSFDFKIIGLYLLVSKQGIFLASPKMSPHRPVFFEHYWLLHRQLKTQGLYVSCKPTSGLHILDATAGWGYDAANLGSFGATVTLCESNPVMGVLLNAALTQSKVDPLSKRLSLQLMDARIYLSTLTYEAYPDVIYYDPMHPKRTKNALVKKDLQLLQGFIAPPSIQTIVDDIQYFREKVKQRVVLKWPSKKDCPLKSNWVVQSKTISYNVFLPL